MKRLIVLSILWVFLILSLMGCTRESGPMYETAKVVAKSYVPKVITKVAPSTGITGNGDIVFTGGTTSTSQEIWAIVVECSEHHRSFAINNKEIWASVQIGDVLDLTYIEIQQKVGDEWVAIDYHTTGVSVSKRSRAVVPVIEEVEAR